MKLNQLIMAASDGYPDHFLDNYWDYSKSCLNEAGSGDGLARFIVTELAETFDPEAGTIAQLAEAIRVLEKAKQDLDGVIQYLERRRVK